MEFKIAFIVLLFGKYEWYLSYFLASCKYNQSIDFYILTDFPNEFHELSSNIRVLEYTKEQFVKDASQSLGFKISLERNYKICDFRPAIGLIFNKLISGYDFWGYCDVDLVFGNIRDFINNELLKTYDIISARHDYLTGCFALYRNTPKINNMFKLSKDFMHVFTNPKNFCFDEAGTAYQQFFNNVPIDKIVSEIESMTEVVKKQMAKHKVKAYFELLIIEGTPGNILFDNGRLFYKNEFEILLYHMIKFKNIYIEEITNTNKIPLLYMIEEDSIHTV